MFPDSASLDRKYVYRQETVIIPRFRLAWDDEVSDWGYKCRTQGDGWVGPDNPPAVMKYYPAPKESGDYRVNLTKDVTWKWRDTIIALNNGDTRKFDYITGDARALYNSTGWAQQAYLAMSGNEIHVLERVGQWVKFQTLRPQDWALARRLTIGALVHRFTCVTWKDGKTVHIESTGTARGDVLYPLVTWEGYGWMPSRFVKEL
jgi:hypothetical protein